MYELGMKALKRLCSEQSMMTWHKAKLSDALFRGAEKAVYAWIEAHVQQYHVLPQLETLQAAWPAMTPVQTPEPSLYYLMKVESAYFYSQINNANIESQGALKMDQDNWKGALEILKTASQNITKQQFRTKIMDLGQEAPGLVLGEYHGVGKAENVCYFGWPYLDHQTGGIMPGDIVSFVGRPAQGKSWMLLYIALHNWRVHKKNVLFVSMEMGTLAIAQRITAMYAKVPYGQLKNSGFTHNFAGISTYKKFTDSMAEMSNEDAKLYVVDGNLAVGVDEVYALADLLDCDTVLIDGAYLMKHKDKRLDRFQRVAENVELIKLRASDHDLSTFCSWQFNRAAAKMKTGEKPGLEDIGMSDAIPQISSVVIGMSQEESVETMLQRKLEVMKGRSGEVGSFSVNWLFDEMDFSQVMSKDQKMKELEVASSDHGHSAKEATVVKKIKSI